MISIFLYLPRVFVRVIHFRVQLLWPRDRPQVIHPSFATFSRYSTPLCCRLAVMNEFLFHFQPLPFSFPLFP